MVECAIKFGFGVVEHLLAKSSGIASHKRSQFQGRLRNFQRFGIPRGVAAGKGKAAAYGPGEIAQLALAIELTELGLLPERVAEVFECGTYPLLMAVRFAADNLVRHPTGFDAHEEREADPPSTFLYCDPSALAPLKEGYGQGEDTASQTFFYIGAEDLRHNLLKWTSGPTPRLAIINVTGLLWNIGQLVGELHGVTRNIAEHAARELFFRELGNWADAEIDRTETEGAAKERSEIQGADLAYFVMQTISNDHAPPDSDSEADALLEKILEANPGLRRDLVKDELYRTVRMRAEASKLPAEILADDAATVRMSAGPQASTDPQGAKFYDELSAVIPALSEGLFNKLTDVFHQPVDLNLSEAVEALYYGVAIPSGRDLVLTPLGWACSASCADAKRREDRSAEWANRRSLWIGRLLSWLQ